MVAVCVLSCPFTLLATQQGRRRVCLLPRRGETGYLPERGTETLRLPVPHPLLRLQRVLPRERASLRQHVPAGYGRKESRRGVLCSVTSSVSVRWPSVS